MPRGNHLERVISMRQIPMNQEVYYYFFLLRIYKGIVVREDLKKPEVIGPKRPKCQVTGELFFPSSVPGTSGFGKSLGK